jgi:acid phosphatase type 7
MASTTKSPTMLVLACLLVIVVAGLIWNENQHPRHFPAGSFIAKPYLQLGPQGKLSILWQTAGVGSDRWTFESKASDESKLNDGSKQNGESKPVAGSKPNDASKPRDEHKPSDESRLGDDSKHDRSKHEKSKSEASSQENGWECTTATNRRQLNIDSIEPFEVFSVDVTEYGVKPFDYRILKNGKVEFSAHADERARSTSQYSFAVMGDCGADTLSQRKIAYQIYTAKPNFILITGDIVYPDGRASEYLHHFFPIYNNDHASPHEGAPLMRSTLMAAVPGNHDVGRAALFDVRNMDVFPDSLAYFYEWSQPLNGPGEYGEPNTPMLLHNPERQERFRLAAGKNYPKMSTFYFDIADARFVMLDADHYMDWSNKDWRKWLDDALTAAKDKKWRFVLYHQTAFNSDTSHFSEQRMRAITDILEKHDVRIVFAGHVHNYQRTYPLHFKPEAMDAKGMIGGQLDFAGAGVAPHPGQITYITSGAGGAHLTGTQISLTPDKWQPFTEKFIAKTHSFSLCEVNGNKLAVKQISEDGAVLDEFSVR